MVNKQSKLEHSESHAKTSTSMHDTHEDIVAQLEAISTTMDNLQAHCEAMVRQELQKTQIKCKLLRDQVQATGEHVESMLNAMRTMLESKQQQRQQQQQQAPTCAETEEKME